MGYAEDITTITQILNHYCQSSDKGLAREVAGMFRHDAVLEGGPTALAEGSDAILAWYENRLAELLAPVAQMRHRLTSPAIDLDGDVASCRAFWDFDMLLNKDGEFGGVTAGPGELLHAAGVYDVDLARQESTWKITRLRINASWVERAPLWVLNSWVLALDRSVSDPPPASSA